MKKLSKNTSLHFQEATYNFVFLKLLDPRSGSLNLESRIRIEMNLHDLVTLPHRRRIDLEYKAKVITSDWGTES